MQTFKSNGVFISNNSNFSEGPLYWGDSLSWSFESWPGISRSFRPNYYMFSMSPIVLYRDFSSLVLLVIIFMGGNSDVLKGDYFASGYS